MYHYMIDAYNYYHTELDDVLFIQEVMVEIPKKLGIKATMPPILIPYYDGVENEDSGVSAFVFFDGGHFTLHTFSTRKIYFADICYKNKFDKIEAEHLFSRTFSFGKEKSYFVDRTIPNSGTLDSEYKKNLDFGPHIFIDFDMEEINVEKMIDIFDSLPAKLGMHPIIRPFIVKNKTEDGLVYSIITMIAESHICLHYFENQKKGYFDIFSCKHFNTDSIVDIIEKEFKIKNVDAEMIARGEKYSLFKQDREEKAINSREWINNIR